MFDSEHKTGDEFGLEAHWYRAIEEAINAIEDRIGSRAEDGLPETYFPDYDAIEKSEKATALIEYAISEICRRIQESDEQFEANVHVFLKLKNYVYFLSTLVDTYVSKLTNQDQVFLNQSLEQAKGFIDAIEDGYAEFERWSGHIATTASQGLGFAYSDGERSSMQVAGQAQEKLIKKNELLKRIAELKIELTVASLLKFLEEVRGHLVPGNLDIVDPRTEDGAPERNDWKPLSPEALMEKILHVYLELADAELIFSLERSQEVFTMAEMILTQFADDVFTLLAEVVYFENYQKVDDRLAHVLVLITRLSEAIIQKGWPVSIDMVLGLTDFMALPVVLESGDVTREYRIATNRALADLLAEVPDEDLVIVHRSTKLRWQAFFTGKKPEESRELSDDAIELLKRIDEIGGVYQDQLDARGSSSQVYSEMLREGDQNDFLKIKTRLKQRMNSLMGGETK